MMINNKTTLGIGYMILSGLFFGGVWIFSKMVVQDIAPFTFTALRLGAALIVLGLLGFRYIPKIREISSSDRKWILIAAVFGMTRGAIFFTLSIKRTTVTNASFLFFLPAVLLPIGGAMFSGLKIKLSTYFAILLCICGLYLLFDPNISGTSIKGNIFALLAGVSNMIYILMIKRLSHLPPRLTSMAVFLFLVIILIAIALVVEGNQVGVIGMESWKIIGYLGLCIAGAYFFMNKTLQHLTSYLTGVLAIGEPLAATALGVLFLGEMLTISAILGLGAILLGFVLISMDKGLMG